MATRIRMQRAGRKGIPFYRIAVFDSRTKRDGRFIEKLGFYDPLAKSEDRRVVVDAERYQYWISQGAQETEAMRSILKGPLGAAGVTQPTQGAGKRERRRRHRKKAKAAKSGS